MAQSPCCTVCVMLCPQRTATLSKAHCDRATEQPQPYGSQHYGTPGAAGALLLVFIRGCFYKFHPRNHQHTLRFGLDRCNVLTDVLVGRQIRPDNRSSILDADRDAAVHVRRDLACTTMGTSGNTLSRGQGQICRTTLLPTKIHHCCHRTLHYAVSNVHES
jgi:hypothetical protein